MTYFRASIGCQSCMKRKALNRLVPLGLIHATHRWFRGFHGQRVGDLPCPNCSETAVWENGYRTDRLFAVLIAEDGLQGNHC